eukprot:6175025-Pleurochrysis_carterae.AAC.1
MPAPCKDDLRHLSNFFTRKGGGKGSVGRRVFGLLETLRIAVNQRRKDSDVAGLSAIDAEKQLLMRWGGINFYDSNLESSVLFSKAAAETAASAAASAASTSAHSCACSSRHRAGSSSLPSECRSQLPLAGSSTGSSHTAA